MKTLFSIFLLIGCLAQANNVPDKLLGLQQLATDLKATQISGDLFWEQSELNRCRASISEDMGIFFLYVSAKLNVSARPNLSAETDELAFMIYFNQEKMKLVNSINKSDFHNFGLYSGASNEVFTLENYVKSSDGVCNAKKIEIDGKKVKITETTLFNCSDSTRSPLISSWSITCEIP